MRYDVVYLSSAFRKRSRMTEKSSLQVLGNHFEFRLSGKALPPAQILEKMQAVVRLCREHGIKKGIVYRTEAVRQIATVVDFYYFSKFLADQGMRGYCIALVFPREPEDDKIDFLQTTAANRGIHFRRFETYAEAQAWIAEN